MNGVFSAPTSWQSALMKRVLDVEIDHVDILRDQVHSALTRVVDADGSFQVSSSSPEWPVETSRVPLEAETVDTDGVSIQILVHIFQGRIQEFEIYRADGEPPTKEFDLNDLNVRVMSREADADGDT